MARARRTAGAAALAAVLACACSGDVRPPDTAGLVPMDPTGADTGLRVADRPRPFQFPRDHGPHPDYRLEWWYLSGQLAAEGGARFGYQLTFFRMALAPGPLPDDSPWRTNQAYMAHLALTDVEEVEHHGFERFARGAVGLAGARWRPFRVWLYDWSLEGAGSGPFPLRLRAREGALALDLTLHRGHKGPVPHGDRGLSRKSHQPGIASYYYSFTRLPTEGTVTTGRRRFRVAGNSWMDHEWGAGVLGEGQTGWDWFALQLDDGRDLMLYRVRGEGVAPYHFATLVAASGLARSVDLDGLAMRPRGTWTSPRSGRRYPAGWVLEIPGEELAMEVTPLLPGQEMVHSFTYWEGAVRVQGRGPEGPIRGRGYLEMTGYAGGSD